MAADLPLHAPADAGQFVRVAERERAPLAFTLDGASAVALAGDTVLTAILVQRRHLRTSEFGDAPRAGFCLIGACQDCWVRTEDGTPLRACSTRIAPGMRIVTRRTAYALANANGESQ